MGAHEIGRGDLLPGRRVDGLPGDVHALWGQPRDRLGDGVGVGVL
jgi:hypothetical protein